jgi:cobalt-zinc-cadmium efflux system membrane fusion protein
MIGRLSVLAVALVTGIALASFFPELPQRLRAIVALSSGPAPQAQEPAEHKPGATDDQQGVVKLDADAIEAAGIEVAAVEAGTIGHRVVVPGMIVPHADRIAQVSVRLPAMVTELQKRLGDRVDKGEIVAVLESREVADAKSDYLAARLTNDLQQDLFDREKALWDKRVSSEQQWLRARNSAANAKMRFDTSRQKLFALGVTAQEVAALPDQPETSLRRQEVLAPMSGRIVERKVELGAIVGRDNLETELFVIADLDRVWVEVAVSPEDAPLVRNGQTVSVAARGVTEKAEGKVIFISPMLDKNTHSARVVAEIDNNAGVWRPGSFVTAAIAFGEQSVPLAVPVGALQTMDGGPVAFVRTAEGFQRRQVVLGQSDDRAIEVVSGLHLGETIAVTNTFLLKAEMLKGAAED